MPIGDQFQTREVQEDAQEVIFTFNIPAAKTHLQTWFTEPDGEN